MSQNESQSPNSNSPAQSSTPPDPRLREKLTEVIGILQNNGVDFQRIIICMLGAAELIMGELTSHTIPTSSDDLDQHGLAGRNIILQNPKRIIRRQEQRGDVVSIEYYASSLDLLDKGNIELKPVGVMPIIWMDDRSILSYLGLLASYFLQKKMEESGIVPASPSLYRPNLRGGR